MPQTQHTQLLLSGSAHSFQHPLRGHPVPSPNSNPPASCRGGGAPTASAAGEPLLLSLASPPLLEVPGTGNDPTSWRFRYINRVLPQFLTASL